MRRFYVVSLEVPRDALCQDVLDYLQDAVRSHCGGLYIEDPMFDLNRVSVKVSEIPRRHVKP